MISDISKDRKSVSVFSPSGPDGALTCQSLLKPHAHNALIRCPGISFVRSERKHQDDSQRHRCQRCNHDHCNEKTIFFQLHEALTSQGLRP